MQSQVRMALVPVQGSLCSGTWPSLHLVYNRTYKSFEGRPCDPSKPRRYNGLQCFIPNVSPKQRYRKGRANEEGNADASHEPKNPIRAQNGLPCEASGTQTGREARKREPQGRKGAGGFRRERAVEWLETPVLASVEGGSHV
jgi:hypothetical protein